ncbi:transporter substrate-binding domain-containing protein [uncultured Thiocystis sp.]|uniref:transporter substrate-binding domain-containing protein n=1 Tax=uncultured Thiocystis sp. TaxID=1202134 RepID=UPI0025DF8FDC|nr:transporter substrate-binding domain-containing protein [uncultured Thiocystis sp.]
MQCSLMSARRPLGLLVALALIGGWLASASLYGAEADVTERPESASGIVLTPEERAWLDAHPDIVLGMSDRFQPALIRADDGRLSGIVPDYLELINRRLGTNIRLAVSSSWEDLGQQAERREIDGLAAGGRKTARDRFVNHTLPYLVTYYYLYIRADETLATTRLDELAGKRIGYLKGALHPRSILDRYPGVIPVPLANQEDMAAALTNRRVDLVFDILFLEWWRKQHAQVSFKIGGLVEGHSNPLTFAIRNDWPLLPGILNQALRDIPESEHARIKNRWLDEVVQEPGSRLTLTTVERDWLAEHPVIR